MLQALKPVADAVDPGGVTVLAEVFAREAAGQGEEAGTTSGKDATAAGSGEAGGSGGGGAEQNGGVESLLPVLPAPSPEAQSVFVDLGRTALKVCRMACLGMLVVVAFTVIATVLLGLVFENGVLPVFDGSLAVAVFVSRRENHVLLDPRLRVQEWL